MRDETTTREQILAEIRDALETVARFDCETEGYCEEPEYGCGVYGTMSRYDMGEYVRYEDVVALLSASRTPEEVT